MSINCVCIRQTQKADIILNLGFEIWLTEWWNKILQTG